MKPGEPFVEQQQARLGGKRAGELQPFAVDIGEVGRRPPVVPGKADAIEQRVDPNLGLGGGQMRLLERQPRLDVLAAIHAVEHADELEGPRQAKPRDPVRGKAGDVPAHQADGAGIGTQHARHQIERRRLAGPVGAEQAHDLALPDRKAEVVDRDQPAERAPQAADFEYRCSAFPAHAATRCVVLPPGVAASFSNNPATPRGSM